MVLLAGLVFLPPRSSAGIGLVVIARQPLRGIFGRDAAVAVARCGPSSSIRSAPSCRSARRSAICVLYSLVPWIGVMAAGYGFGAIIAARAARATPLLPSASASRDGAVPRAARARRVRRSAPWRPHAGAACSLALNHEQVSGVAALSADDARARRSLLPLAERARGALARWLSIFGRVPFFYYLLHIPLTWWVAPAALFVGHSIAARHNATLLK